MKVYIPGFKDINVGVQCVYQLYWEFQICEINIFSISLRLIKRYLTMESCMMGEWCELRVT